MIYIYLQILTTKLCVYLLIPNEHVTQSTKRKKENQVKFSPQINMLKPFVSELLCKRGYVRKRKPKKALLLSYDSHLEVHICLK